MVNSAKALLTAENTKTNTHAGIIKDFDEIFIGSGKITLSETFEDFVLQLNKNEPTEEFAKSYLNDATDFLEKVETHRKLELKHV